MLITASLNGVVGCVTEVVCGYFVVTLNSGGGLEVLVGIAVRYSDAVTERHYFSSYSPTLFFNSRDS